MGNIIVAFSKPQDGRNIRNILVKHGIQVTASCTSGAQVLSLTDDLRSGIVVSGYRFGDMTCRQLADQLPPGFDLLLIASPSRWSGEAMGRIVCLPAPFKMGDLVSTVRMIEQTQAEKRRRMRRQPPQKHRPLRMTRIFLRLWTLRTASDTTIAFVWYDCDTKRRHFCYY